MRGRIWLIRPIVALTGALLASPGASARAQESATAPRHLIDEPSIIERAVISVDRISGNAELTNGFYWDVWNMIPGAGWISGGPGYRRWYAKDRAFVDASGAVSWTGYKTAQARLELPRLARSRLALGSQVRWSDFTHVSFFGEGDASRPSDRSAYRIRSQNLAGYLILRPVKWASIGAQAGWLQPSLLPCSGWFEGNCLDTRDVFPSAPAFVAAHQPTFVHREASVTADTRDAPRHPTRGGLYRAAAASYTASGGVFSFRRYEAEAAHFVPIGDSRVVVALHGWLVASDAGKDHVVPLYLQPSLGGHNTLRSYPDYRFHDRNLLAINAEGRIALMAHVDAAVFVDGGSVAPQVRSLNLNKRSYGAGLRLHTRELTFARLDIATGGEGWRLVFRLSDPLDLSRLTRRTANAPFVP